MASKRILFVDDRPDFAHQPVVRLGMEGYQVDQASNEDEAVIALKGRRYDLLIFDAELPGTDGWKVLRRLRDDPATGNVKVLVFMAKKGETERLKLVPVDAELRRPFRLENLVEKVNGLLTS